MDVIRNIIYRRYTFISKLPVIIYKRLKNGTCLKSETQFHKHYSTFNEKNENKAIYVKLQNGTFSKYIMIHSSRGLQNKHKNGSKNANSSRMLN